MNVKAVLCTTLAAALLCAPVLAAGGADREAASPSVPPSDAVSPPLAPAEETEMDKTPAFSPVKQDTALPVMVYGAVSELGEDRLRLQNDNGYAKVSDIVLTLGEDTLILDAVTGEKRSLSDIRDGDTLYAYAGPAMTRSLPPISNAVLLLCNLPADFAAPAFAEVQLVSAGGEGRLSALVTGDIQLHLSGDTRLLPGPGDADGAVDLGDIVPGARLLSWYDTVLESYPAQAYPSRVMVFPYGYTGYVEIRAEGGLSLNGEGLDLAPLAAEDGTLLLPVRAFAEAQGCGVVWDPVQPDLVRVEKGGAELYSFRAGAGEATVEGDMVMSLAAPALAKDGVTYLAARDLVGFHGLKLVGSWPEG